MLNRTEQEHMRSKKFISKIFINILVSYLIVLLIPMTFIGIMYKIAGDSIHNNIIGTNQVVLAQSMKAIEDKFNNMRRVMMSFSRQPNLLDYVLNESIDLAFIAKSIELKDQIEYIQSTNDLIDKIFIYSSHNGQFYSDSGLADLSVFVESYYKTVHVQSLDLPSILTDSHMGRFLALSQITQIATPADQVSVNNVTITKDQMTFIQTLPVALSNQNDGAIIVLLNTSYMTQLLAYGGVLNGGSVAIVDADGNKLVEIIGFSNDTDGDKYNISYADDLEGNYHGSDVIVSKIVSPTTKWTYITALPESAVLATLIRVGRIAAILVIAMLLVCLILIIYLARYNALPFTQISQLISGQSDENEVLVAKENKYGNFVDSVSRLVESNKTLHKTVHEQKDLLTYSFFNRLLSGDFSSINDINSFLGRLNLSFDGTGYVVILIRLFSKSIHGIQMIEDFHEAGTIVDNLSESLLNGKIFVHKPDIGNHIILFNPYFTKKTDAECHMLINDSMTVLYDQLMLNLPVCFHMAVGGYYTTSIKDVSLSAKEAQRALAAYDFDTDQSVLVWYDERQNKECKDHYYSLVFEQHLLNQIEIGNETKVRELLTAYYTNNIVKKKLSLRALDMIKYELISTLVRAIQDTRKNNASINIADNIKLEKPIDEFFSKVIQVAVELCNANTEPDHSETDDTLADLLIAFIHKHMGEQDLSCVNICEHFNISRYHLNKYLQEKTGIGFTGYLETLRLEKAVELLEDSDLTIQKISNRVGYVNSKTFRAVFKRSFGYSPSDRRLKSKIVTGMEQ